MTVLITGVSRGLGHALAAAAISRGMAVAGIVRNPAAESVKELAARGMRVFDADLSDPLSIAGLIAQLREADVVPRTLVLNAGLMADDFGERVDAECMQKVLATNLLAPLLLISYFLPAMAASKGLVIAISSLSARLATDPRRVAYPASKAGLSMALSALRLRRDLPSVRFVTVEAGRIAAAPLPLAVTYEAAALRILALMDDPDPPATVAFPASAALIFGVLGSLPAACRSWIVDRRSKSRSGGLTKTKL